MVTNTSGYAATPPAHEARLREDRVFFFIPKARSRDLAFAIFSPPRSGAQTKTYPSTPGISQEETRQGGCTRGRSGGQGP